MISEIRRVIGGYTHTALETTRQLLLRTLSRLIASLESPSDVIHRYGHMTLQTAAIRIGIDLGVFRLLTQAQAEGRGAVSVDGIVERNPGAGGLVLNRILRYLASIDAITQVSPTRYAANQRTRHLADKTVEAGLAHFLNTVAPQYEALPAWLAQNNYQPPADETHTAFQAAWNTHLDAFAWFAEHADHLAYFNDYMALRRQRAHDATWLSVFPVARYVRGWNPDVDRGVKESAGRKQKAVYVNVGGGIGHQCREFRERYPDVTGEVVLQDLPHSIANALETPGVVNMEFDFFEEQPVKDAKFYYMRGILHDHSPARGRVILEHTRDAMGPESILLVDEMILPETGVSQMAAAIDLTMLAALGGQERTEAQWRETLAEAGLELVETYMYAPLLYEGVMVVRRGRGVEC
ncbi:S-adenosyl-L-methionine-dependent methyltransferase [Pseudovirgaria hyperparasitica]|uniref:S-adenosyl-L-methionine-dependent methyltransferase n=1 Tax=Pseudovirgaria hyperparasitica TaxID=470096 RepID=A0A6A6W3Q9_9PEZI|nr:S-adenosyl-L-methionine-dependent methyltransferase [Pseudovirgaria hyperparasitica]KAF2757492.1 S-adenosyl-L-methionine-dependent methyltransferase [Pseudovirgaria hyperparasitica]